MKTTHKIIIGDSRWMNEVPDESVNQYYRTFFTKLVNSIVRYAGGMGVEGGGYSSGNVHICVFRKAVDRKYVSCLCDASTAFIRAFRGYFARVLHQPYRYPYTCGMPYPFR